MRHCQALGYDVHSWNWESEEEAASSDGSYRADSGSEYQSSSESDSEADFSEGEQQFQTDEFGLSLESDESAMTIRQPVKLVLKQQPTSASLLPGCIYNLPFYTTVCAVATWENGVGRS